MKASCAFDISAASANIDHMLRNALTWLFCDRRSSLENSFHEFAVMVEEICEIEANSYFQRVTALFKILHESLEVNF